jgi:hypothetical protein
MATIGQELKTPEAGWKRIDDTDANILYTGAWTNSSVGYPYGDTQHVVTNATPTTSVEFQFIGSKIRIVAPLITTRSANMRITIDGVSENYSLKGSATYATLLYEKQNLEYKTHKVKIDCLDTEGIAFDAFDIDSTGRSMPAFFNVVTKLSEINTIGDAIECEYKGTSNAFGGFSNFGKFINNYLTPSVTPFGVFHWVYVGNDHLGRKKLMADRNLQTGIAWDTLNTTGATLGKIADLNVVDPIPKMASNTSAECIITASANETGTYPAWRAFDKNHSSSVYWHSGSSSGWIKVEFTTPKKIKRYSLQIPVASYPTAWTFEGSNDNSNWVVLDAKTGYSGWSTGERKEFNIDNVNQYKYYKINVTLMSSGNASFSEIEMIEITNEPYLGILRLPTGGVSPTDKDNEWDKYIVESTLGGKITAGYNAIWNWNGIYSWASTTLTGSSYRVVRGNTAVGTHASNTSSTTANHANFRPMLIIEKINIPPEVDASTVQINPTNLWYTDTGDVVFSGTATDINEGSTIKYKVLVNDVEVQPYSTPLPSPISMSALIPRANFTSNQCVLKIVVEDNDRGIINFTYTINKEDINTTTAVRNFDFSTEWENRNADKVEIVYDTGLKLKSGLSGDGGLVLTTINNNITTHGRGNISGVVIDGTDDRIETVSMINNANSQALDVGKMFEFTMFDTRKAVRITAIDVVMT